MLGEFPESKVFQHGVSTIYTFMLVGAMDTILTGYVHVNALLRSQT